MSDPSRQVAVRPVNDDEVSRIVEFLKAEFTPDLSRDQIRRLFTYAWCDPKPDLGFVLTVGGEIVGFIATIYSQRERGGVPHRFCNASTWYVRKEHRAASLSLLVQVIGAPNQVTIALTANPQLRVPQIMRTLGFRTMDTAKAVFPPLMNAKTLLRAGGRVITDVGEIERLLRPEDKRVLRDHLPYECRHWLLSKGQEYSYVITKRRYLPTSWVFGDWRRLADHFYPVTEILHIGNRQLGFRHWERLKLNMMWRDRSIAIVADTRIVGDQHPWARRLPHQNLVYGPIGVDPPDNLYSELVLLPI